MNYCLAILTVEYLIALQEDCIHWEVEGTGFPIQLFSPFFHAIPKQRGKKRYQSKEQSGTGSSKLPIALGKMADDLENSIQFNSIQFNKPTLTVHIGR